MHLNFTTPLKLQLLWILPAVLSSLQHLLGNQVLYYPFFSNWVFHQEFHSKIYDQKIVQLCSSDLPFPVYDNPQCHLYSHLYFMNKRYLLLYLPMHHQRHSRGYLGFQGYLNDLYFVICSNFKTLLLNNLFSSFKASIIDSFILILLSFTCSVIYIFFFLFFKCCFQFHCY